ncbi:hypothetical protein MO973_27155, partial [Paenibacillus sp. TRM 82003]|nr:hypothetical protein [Paenibacillus sp. TRM 82003]
RPNPFSNLIPSAQHRTRQQPIAPGRARTLFSNLISSAQHRTRQQPIAPGRARTLFQTSFPLLSIAPANNPLLRGAPEPFFKPHSLYSATFSKQNVPLGGGHAPSSELRESALKSSHANPEPASPIVGVRVGCY